MDAPEVPGLHGARSAVQTARQRTRHLFLLDQWPLVPAAARAPGVAVFDQGPADVELVDHQHPERAAVTVAPTDQQRGHLVQGQRGQGRAGLRAPGLARFRSVNVPQPHRNGRLAGRGEPQAVAIGDSADQALNSAWLSCPGRLDSGRSAHQNKRQQARRGAPLGNILPNRGVGPERLRHAQILAGFALFLQTNSQLYPGLKA